MSATMLVTGGAGFIGSHVVRALLVRGDRVRVVDDFSTGDRSGLAALPGVEAGRLEWIEADLTSAGVAASAVRGVDTVFHLAAMASVPATVADPVRSEAVNVLATVALFDAARRAGVHRVVFSSSSAIYGDGPASPRHEDDPPRPESPYALQKLAGEQYAALFGRIHGLSITCLRYFNVVGAGQRADSGAVVPRWAAAMRAGRPIPIQGDGLQTRDFVSVSDVVAANLAVADEAVPGGLLLNVARGEATTLLDLADRLGRLLDVRPVLEFLPPRAGDVRHSVADVSRLRSVLPWSPRDLDATLRDAIATAGPA